MIRGQILFTLLLLAIAGVTFYTFFVVRESAPLPPPPPPAEFFELKPSQKSQPWIQ